MNDNDWIKQLQSMMERHEESIPDDLWQGIEARLPEQQAPPRMMPAWRRYAAAVVALAIIGTGGLLWLSNTEDPEGKPIISMSTPEENSPESETLAQNDKIAVTEVDAVVTSSHIAPVAPVHPQTVLVNDTAPSEYLAQAQHPSETTPAQDTNENESIKRDEEKAEQPVEKSTTRLINATPNPNVTGNTILLPARKKMPLTLDLYASNSINPVNTVKGGLLFTSLADSTVLPPDQSGEYFKANHHSPVSLGVSVRVPLTDRLSFTSGLVYTRLKSDFTSYRKKNEQTLHYLGIPLGLTYAIWGFKRFNVYAIGGMQADFNVRASIRQNTQISNTDIGKDRVQFSALVGPGLQFAISQEFSLYVEPTARFYFNNGSDIDNYFKDKPWNINLNAGLRFTLE